MCTLYCRTFLRCCGFIIGLTGRINGIQRIYYFCIILILRLDFFLGGREDVIYFWYKGYCVPPQYESLHRILVGLNILVFDDALLFL